MSRTWKRPTIEISPARRFTVYGRFTWFRATKSGMPVLKTASTRIRDINGFLLQTKKRRYSVVFRRHSPFGP